jgi:uncharacterized protein YkwD
VPKHQEAHLTGKHRGPRLARPYVAAALLAFALVAAGAGAALSHPAISGRASDDRAAGGSGAAPLAPGDSAASPDPGGSSPAPVVISATPQAPASAPPSQPARPSPKPTTSRRGSTPPASGTSQIVRLENEVTAIVNQERARAGCGAVHTDERLRTAARGHSADMAANNYFSHTGQDGRSPWDRARQAGYEQASGENIAFGQRTPADVMAAWMNSPLHRANILNCASKAIGVGLAYRGNTPYWTQLFGRV